MTEDPYAMENLAAVARPAPEPNAALQQEAFSRIKPTIGAGNEALINSGLLRNPTDSFARWLEMQYAESSFSDSKQISAEEANARFGMGGLVRFDAPTTEIGAVTLMLAKQRELELNDTINRARPGTFRSFGVGLMTTMLDPINIASMFIPVLGEERLVGGVPTLVNSGNRFSGTVAALNRLNPAMRRFATGAVEGGVGALVAEPLTQLAAQKEQADYGYGDSITNLVFGSVAGGALHAGTGVLHDWLRGLTPETRKAMMAAAVAHDAQDRPVNIADIAKMDPRVIEKDAEASLAKKGVTRPADPNAEFDKLEAADRAAKEQAAKTTEAPRETPSPKSSESAVGAEPKLPRELEKGSPRYKTNTLGFESDLERAAYIIGNEKNRSKADSQYLAFVMKHTGMSEGQARDFGKTVRERVKQAAAGAGEGEHVTIAKQAEARPVEKATAPVAPEPNVLRNAVEKKLKAGEAIPPRILNQFPDLVEKYRTQAEISVKQYEAAFVQQDLFDRQLKDEATAIGEQRKQELADKISKEQAALENPAPGSENATKFDSEGRPIHEVTKMGDNVGEMEQRLLDFDASTNEMVKNADAILTDGEKEQIKGIMETAGRIGTEIKKAAEQAAVCVVQATFL